jgi:XTP/dITP diphosphohydrolase
MQLLFCSSNLHKTKEIQYKLGTSYVLKSLNDVGFTGEIEETALTFEGNAKLKAEFGFQHYNLPCFSDDSGLEVEALNQEPGVFSARYAGESKDDQNNMDKLLLNLKGLTNRKARFKTVIVYIDSKGDKFVFEGSVSGRIIEEKRGSQGFGYDPIFIPDGYDRTFAEMNIEEKSILSHRARALEKFIHFLGTQQH